ncbi:hypothetical protein ABH961_000036 [Bacillus sp. RC251]|uniref:hypothetical protein n=1 Tax=Bacillus TaxID=1386 RepID=UPI000BF082AE|nr:hypothetical protein [Bacillus wiedmannii]PEM96459.1 hypothetical protein CN621_28070 [Bacillus wiedmannii]
MKKFKKLMTLKEHIVIWIFVIALSIVMLIIQYYRTGLTEGFWLSLIPSIIIDSLFILIGSYFITYLLQKNEEKRAKNKVYKMLGKRYEKMVMELAKDYINFITKKPCETKGDINNIEDVKEQVLNLHTNIKTHVKSNFLSENVKVLEFDSTVQTNNILEMFKEVGWTVQTYTKYFKVKNSKDMDSFITKYISVIPEDLRERLFKVEDTLQSGVFTTPMDFNVPLNTTNAIFSPEEFALIFKELGEDIYFLLTYFEEIQEAENASKKFKGGLFHLFTAENFILSLLWLMLIYITTDFVFKGR